jgi:glycerol-1-phosphate dehydrogenase [NAD(P)+]
VYIPIPDLLRIKPGILPKAGKYLKQLGLQRIVVLYGTGLEALYTDILATSFADYGITCLHSLTLADNDSQHLFALSQQFPAGLDGLFALGGGLALDGAKYLSHLTHLPLLVCPGTLSNDGFASPFSSLLVQGRRTTVRTRMPRGVMVDLELVQRAPQGLYYAGVGDLISNYTAIEDWKRAFHAQGIYVDDFAVSLAQMAVDAFVRLPDLSPANLDAWATLAQGLLMSGIAMEIAGSSRPASGAEHLISHALDRDAERPMAHGLQVGLASYWTSQLSGKHTATIAQALESSGCWDWLRQQQPVRQEWIVALGAAQAIKPGFYTGLDTPGALSILEQRLDEDPRLQAIFAT